MVDIRRLKSTMIRWLTSRATSERHDESSPELFCYGITAAGYSGVVVAILCGIVAAQSGARNATGSRAQPAVETPPCSDTAEAASRPRTQRRLTRTSSPSGRTRSSPAGIADAAKATRVRDLDGRSSTAACARFTTRATRRSPRPRRRRVTIRTVAEAWVAVAQGGQTSVKLLHAASAVRGPAGGRADAGAGRQVKDGMTYGVVQVTYKRYCECCPSSHEEQQPEILANLLEAREYAMDAGSSEEKHAWIRQVQRPNQQLPFGRRLRHEAGGKDLAERQKAARQPDVQQ